MNSKYYYDKFIEQEKDFTELTVAEQLKLFKKCAPYNVNDIRKQFGDNFIMNGIRAKLFVFNPKRSENLWVDWTKYKKFEKFVETEDANDLLNALI